MSEAITDSGPLSGMEIIFPDGRSIPVEAMEYEKQREEHVRKMRKFANDFSAELKLHGPWQCKKALEIADELVQEDKKFRELTKDVVVRCTPVPLKALYDYSRAHIANIFGYSSWLEFLKGEGIQSSEEIQSSKFAEKIYQKLVDDNIDRRPTLRTIRAICDDADLRAGDPRSQASEWDIKVAAVLGINPYDSRRSPLQDMFEFVFKKDIYSN